MSNAIRSTFRAYFYAINTDGTRTELTEHPMHGAEWLGSGRYAMGANGAYIPDTAVSVEVEKNGQLMALTPESFPGQRVAFKQWHPKGGTCDWRTLAADAV